MNDSPISLHIDTPTGPRTVLLDHGQRMLPLTEVLRHFGLPLNTRCGQRGKCDGCLVDLLQGSVISLVDGAPLASTGAPLSVRACEYRLSDDPNSPREAQICVPARSLLAYEPQVLKDYRISVPFSNFPLWQQIAVQRQGLDEHAATAEAAAHYLKQLLGLRSAPTLTPAALQQWRQSQDASKVWAVVQYQDAGWTLTAFERNPLEQPLGAAIDIGTTTVVILLVDLRTGQVLAQAADFNAQINLGDDVVTRISLCGQDSTMIARMHEAICEHTIAPLLRQTLEIAHLPPNTTLEALAVAGNTTMQHLFAGADPSGLGTVPFTPKFLEYRHLSGDAVFATTDNSPARPALVKSVHLLPSPAAYVGADLAAGILASGLIYDEGPSLLIDIGTNGEIIFKKQDLLLGCATAAGPAFEGAGLACGMRAGDGAIAYIHLTADPLRIETRRIGQNGHVAGLCGSAYVDFLAEARRIGLIDTMGRFDLHAVPEAQSHIIPWQPRHGAVQDRAMVLAYGQAKRPIVVAEADIAGLLSSKAAIAAGIMILMKRAEVTPDQIKRVYLAGGFGTYMIAANAIACGLLPGFTPEQIIPVGNTSLAGAYLSLVDASAMDEIRRIAKCVQTIELNLDPEFETTYIDQLALPQPAIAQSRQWS